MRTQIRSGHPSTERTLSLCRSVINGSVISSALATPPILIRQQTLNVSDTHFQFFEWTAGVSGDLAVSAAVGAQSRDPVESLSG